MANSALAYLPEQWPSIRTMLWAGMEGILTPKPAGILSESDWIKAGTVSGEVTAPSKALVRDYSAFCKALPGSYTNELPPHLFPQWTFPLVAKSLMSLGYPLHLVINGGACLHVNDVIPIGQPLSVRVEPLSITPKGRWLELVQEVTTGTSQAPRAVQARMHTLVPAPKKDGGSKNTKATIQIPTHCRELARRRFKKKSGLRFAGLTGDYNPIHWIAPAAQLSGFKTVILHGFATFATAYEVVRKARCPWIKRVSDFNLKFYKPLHLPGDVGIYVGDDSTTPQVFIGKAPGAKPVAYGTFNIE
ncbi:MAG: MaoC/PaaZ C-terminal domain-containing protein [Myxococcota bacterium]|nr:MaoC/PaaZ C-terminal domain-containing protein [Myxococcota bacterium]